jgi:tetratricopeptide (TPR) repeat protein
MAYSHKQQYAEREAAFKKAIEMAPDKAEAYTGLANVYNAQKKFDLAATASAEGRAARSRGRQRRRRRRSDLQPGRAFSGTRASSPRRRSSSRRRSSAIRAWRWRTTSSAWPT